MNGLRQARKNSRLTLKQVSSTLNRTGEWLRRIETGKLPATPDVEARILDAIKRLSELRSASQRNAVNIFADLRMPHSGDVVSEGRS